MFNTLPKGWTSLTYKVMNNSSISYLPSHQGAVLLLFLPPRREAPQPPGAPLLTRRPPTPQSKRGGGGVRHLSSLYQSDLKADLLTPN